MSLSLVIDGQEYNRAKSVSVFRDVRKFAGFFEATLSADEFNNVPVKRSSAIKVINSVGGTIFNGYVDELSVFQGIDQHEIKISGRDITSDLIDSTLVTKKFNGPIEFEALCRQVISEQGVNISILNLAGSLKRIEKTELVSGDIGQGAMEFLDTYAARVQAILTTNDDGRLLILRSDQAANSGLTFLRQRGAIGNIKQSSIRFSNVATFGRYVARSQVAPGNQDVTLETKDLVNQSGSVQDFSFRKSRFFEFVAETPMNSEELKGRADLEANVRRASSVEYSFVAQGDVPSVGINTLVRVTDDTCGVDDNLLVSSVRRVFSQSGTVTVMQCTLSDAYSLSAKKTQIEASRSTADGSFN